jgi:hypothetical protein
MKKGGSQCFLSCSTSITVMRLRHFSMLNTYDITFITQGLFTFMTTFSQPLPHVGLFTFYLLFIGALSLLNFCPISRDLFYFPASVPWFQYNFHLMSGRGQTDEARVSLHPSPGVEPRQCLIQGPHQIDTPTVLLLLLI